ncbi:uncharacterized protein LOC112084354 [Eutrema salsugineum]|uniref:uncharacterized protein LOC112084354 n=1 Tax=Eutrema salsugineum TaxID=72664 RepID=UPI000CED4706|nr:uncharacterized protein LOC112084354 [Eutrema salsugineum]
MDYPMLIGQVILMILMVLLAPQQRLSTDQLQTQQRSLPLKNKTYCLDYHFVRNQIQAGMLQVSHVSTHDQLADMLAKPLLRSRLNSACSKIGVFKNPPSSEGILAKYRPQASTLPASKQGHLEDIQSIAKGSYRFKAINRTANGIADNLAKEARIKLLPYVVSWLF